MKKLDETGKVLASTSGERSELGQFHSPQGIKINSKNEVFVCDRNNSRIQVFDIDLKFRRCIDLTHLNVETKPKPNDLAFDRASNMYVSDYANNCIHQMTSTWYPFPRARMGNYLVLSASRWMLLVFFTSQSPKATVSLC